MDADVALLAAFVALVDALLADVLALLAEVEAADALDEAADADEAAALAEDVADAASTNSVHLAESVFVLIGCEPLDVCCVRHCQMLLVVVSLTMSRT